MKRKYEIKSEGDPIKGFSIQAFEKPGKSEYQYFGPCLNISHDESWLHLNTDDYEGHAMVNIDALPAIIKALRLIQKAINN